MMKRTLVLLVLLACVSGCEGTTTVVYPATTPGGGNPVAPSGIPGATPTPGTTPAFRDRIEFRVLGNATSVRVKHTNTIDGLTQIVTALPYLANLDSTESSVFLSLDATPIAYPFTAAYPFLQVQIFVNGTLFRETSASDFFLTTISVSGTWRH
jgi:hypothetical protein